MMEPSLPDQDGDAVDHDGDVAADVHHPLGEKYHYKAGLVFRDAPEDLGAGPVPQWVEGGLHGQGDGSKQVPQGGVYGTSNVLEIEDLDILNVPICWPGVSQDRTWKTTDVIPPSFSLATAVSSWPEQFRVSHVSHVTGKRSTMFCIVCSYNISIRTQVLQERVSSKSYSSHTMKPTLRRVREGRRILNRIIGYPEDAQEDDKYLLAHPNVGGVVKKFVELPVRSTQGQCYC